MAGEDDDTLELLFFKEVAQNAQLLIVVAHVGHLANLLCGFRYGYLHLNRIVEQLYGKLANLLRHGSREHYALTILGQLLYYLHDVVNKSHVEHTVCLVEYKETAA